MAEDFVFPEDEGTGAAGGDNADAANFASHRHADNLSSYKETGLEVTADFEALTFSVSSGMAHLSGVSAQEAQSSSVRDQGVTYTSILSERSGVSFSGTTEVYLSVDLSSDDTVRIETTEADTDDLSLLLAVIDDSTESVYQTNTEPTVRHTAASQRDTIPSGQTVTVDDGYAYITPETLTVEGTFDVNGRAKVVSDKPTPKRHDHRGEDLRPRVSQVKTRIESWETVMILEDHVHNVGTNYRNEGELTVKGTLACWDEFTTTGEFTTEGDGEVIVRA